MITVKKRLDGQKRSMLRKLAQILGLPIADGIWTGQAPWIGWKNYQFLTSNWVTVTDANDANTESPPAERLSTTCPLGSHLVGTGEGTTDLWYHVEVDSPLVLLISGNRWYRIRSTGYAGLTGMARADNDSPDGVENA